jgi:peptide/nickel transport system substrate-binding protein
LRSSIHIRAGMLLAAVTVSAGIVACGGDDDETSAGTEQPAAQQGAPVAGKPGGKLTVLWTDDLTFSDPGQSYYQMDFMVHSATQRALYGYKPEDGTKMVPDLAESAPEVSADGKTVTVKIRKGVKFSAPVNREVTSKDVKYAIERGFFSTVNNGYAGAYFGALKGAKVGAEPGTQIPGLETPDDQTVIFKLTRPQGGTLASGALGMPLTAPVAEEYAKQFDAKSPSTYGQHQTATGPYMIAQDAKGNAIGYEAGKSLHLVRNPSWDKSTDFKPAYLDEFEMPQGNDDTSVASRKILTGSHMISGDWSPPPATLKEASTQRKSQLVLVPGISWRMVSLNTTSKPFDDINVRKAVLAGFDRNALRLARGGPLVGDMPTHFLPPGMNGFEEAGGMKGPGYDFMDSTGKPNMDLSAEYFKKAGYAAGKYDGTQELLMVGTLEGVAQKAAEVAKENFERLGFKVRMRLVTQDAMYNRYCNVPSANVAICPNVSWGKDFADGQTILDPTFNGENIIPQQNSNWPQLDDKALNAEMDKAKQISDPAERAQAWADVDKKLTALAPSVLWIWDRTPLIASADVNPVVSRQNSMWDLSWISLK